MTAYVDKLLVHPTSIRCFKAGSCHLEADTLEELHAFAARLGLRRAWFQEHNMGDHYDLTPSKRELAVKLGAVEQNRQEASARRRKNPRHPFHRAEEQ